MNYRLKGDFMNYRLKEASAHDTGLRDRSVHCIVTSPPYFGLRSYVGDQGVEWPAVTYSPMPGLPTVTVPGCDSDCDHEWGDEIEWLDGTPGDVNNSSGLDGTQTNGYSKHKSNGQWCQRCGGWRGGLGEEPDPLAYIGHLIAVMREMWRVLRDDGVCWLNMGDSFAGSGGAGGDYQDGGIREGQPKWKPPKINIAAKNKLLMPHRLALALQADGWIVRQDIVWAKGVSCLPSYAGSCMPESVRDRPTNGHEFVFLLTKQSRYFYDPEAVKEKSTGQNGSAVDFARTTKDHLLPGQSAVQHRKDRKPTTDNGGRALRSVFVINPGSYPGAHFATFPERLPELCILAGTSARGVCPACGAPWARDTERTAMEIKTSEKGRQKHADGLRTSTSGTMTKPPTIKTIGWRASCTCFEYDDPDPESGDGTDAHPLNPIPATVLDPFNGAGTTGLVALKHNRHYIGIDLSDEYLEQTCKRFAGLQPMLPGVLA